MTHRLKTLSLAVVVVLALSALAASAASAFSSFTFGASTTTVTGVDAGGVEPVKLSVTGVGITCSEMSYKAHVSSTSVESMTADPSFQGCETSLGTEAKVTGFGDHGEPAKEQCDFVFKANGWVDLACPSGEEVTIDAATCTVHIPSQTNLSSAIYWTDTRNGVHSLELKFSIIHIVANHTDGFLCPMTGSGLDNSSTLSGDVELWGENALGNPVAVTHDPT
jgi:hypothetical protein